MPRLSPNADTRAIIAAVRELSTQVDSIANGKFRITSDLDLGGKRLRNVGRPIDHNDAAIKGQLPGEDFAPIGAAYVVAGNLDVDLTHERLLAASTGITITDNGAGSTVTVAVDSTLLGASFVTLGTNSVLPSERVLTGSSSILVTDGGAGSTVTLSTIASGTSAGTVTVADAAGDTTCFVGLFGSATGTLPCLTDAGLTYNATTDKLTASAMEVGVATGTSATFGTMVTTAGVLNVNTAALAPLVLERDQSNTAAAIARLSNVSTSAAPLGANIVNQFLDSAAAVRSAVSYGGQLTARTSGTVTGEFQVLLNNATAATLTERFRVTNTGLTLPASSTLVVGSATLTPPSATGTLATLAGSESLTNKKLGSLTTNGPVYTSGGDGTLNSEASLDVTRGGTGRATSTTAYGLIAGGTTATGAHQTLAAGATTEILVGGGASALPVWTTATGTGAPVRAGSPALTGTPAIAAATGTSLNLTLGGSQLALGTGEVAMFSNRNAGSDNAAIGINSGSTGKRRVNFYSNGTLASMIESANSGSGAVLQLYADGANTAATVQALLNQTGDQFVVYDIGGHQSFSVEGSSVATPGVSQYSKTIKYNNIDTVSNGVPALYAEANITARTSAISAGTLYTPPTAGFYRVVFAVTLTTAGTTSTLGSGVKLNYTTGDGATAVVQNVPMRVIGASAETFTGSTGNTIGLTLIGAVTVYSSNAAMTYDVGYTSSGTAMQYAARVRVERL